MKTRNKAISKEIQSDFTPSGVLNDLLEGNKRFINDITQSVDNSALIQQTTGGQFPKAVILTFKK